MLSPVTAGVSVAREGGALARDETIEPILRAVIAACDASLARQDLRVLLTSPVEVFFSDNLGASSGLSDSADARPGAFHIMICSSSTISRLQAANEGDDADAATAGVTGTTHHRRTTLAAMAIVGNVTGTSARAKSPHADAPDKWCEIEVCRGILMIDSPLLTDNHNNRLQGVALGNAPQLAALRTRLSTDRVRQTARMRARGEDRLAPTCVCAHSGCTRLLSKAHDGYMMVT